MPYRRLPNTDQARVRALQVVVDESVKISPEQLVISYKLQHDAKTTLNKFERTLGLYKQMYDNQVNSNKDFQQFFRNARMYVSHFIQVLNLSVIRGEIKPEHKECYLLDSDNFSVPEMATADAVLECGKNIIDGETLRIKNGGAPIYNPSIAKVQVHYDIFKEHRSSQLLLQQNTARYAEYVNTMRESVDAVILEIWNDIEEYFSDQPPYRRLQACQQYGIIYYYRKNEKTVTPEDDAEFVKPLTKKMIEKPDASSKITEIQQPDEREDRMLSPIDEQPEEEIPDLVQAVENGVAEENLPLTEMDESSYKKLLLESAIPTENNSEKNGMSSYDKEFIMSELSLNIDAPVKMKSLQTTPKKQKRQESKHNALLSLFFG